MTAKRYAVFDKDGKCINHIMIGDPLPKSYWPGYGAFLIPLEEVDTSNGGAGLDIFVFKFDVNTGPVPQIGDTVNIDTGEVTKFVPQLIVQKDNEGEDITVASAPEVKMERDVEPKKEGEIIVKEDSK